VEFIFRRWLPLLHLPGEFLIKKPEIIFKTNPHQEKRQEKIFLFKISGRLYLARLFL
jgi:hypothetical protein